MEWGYGGAIHGFAANRELEEHYIKMFGAEHLGMLHNYQIFIDEEAAQKIREVYNYEWN